MGYLGKSVVGHMEVVIAFHHVCMIALSIIYSCIVHESNHKQVTLKRNQEMFPFKGTSIMKVLYLILIIIYNELDAIATAHFGLI